jgi:hypothetical protein
MQELQGIYASYPSGLLQWPPSRSRGRPHQRPCTKRQEHCQESALNHIRRLEPASSMKWPPPLGLAVALALVAFHTALKSARSSDKGPGTCQVKDTTIGWPDQGLRRARSRPIELYDVGFILACTVRLTSVIAPRSFAIGCSFFIRSP